MHHLHRRLRRATGLGAVALLALPLAAQAADNRVQFAESFNSGVAGLRPSITLRAVLDNGSGGAPVPTGIAPLHARLAIISTSSAWASMLRRRRPARSSARSRASSRPGNSPLRVISHGKDATGQYVRAGVDVPAQHRRDHRRRQPRPS